MIAEYSHTRIAAKVEALKAIEKIGPKRAGIEKDKKLIIFPQK
jgi:hypothetical protein